MPKPTKNSILPSEISQLSEKELLGSKLSSFQLSLSHSWLRPLIEKLNRELESKHLNFNPHVWISDDWFSPDGSPGFAVPFYLLHPRLIELERRMMGFAEGDTCQEAMKLMRHETGHAIDNAFALRRNKRRQAIFGLTSKAYPKSYVPDPKSKNFVRHLEDHYAQAHPDEDWAETFSVWLTPMSRWQKTYANWPAIDKLECLDHIMKGIQVKEPINSRVNEVDSLATLDITLAQYYKRKTAPAKRANAPLRQIFSAPANSGLPAWSLIESSQDKLTRLVAKKSTLQHNRIKRELVSLKKVCRAENLYYSGNPSTSLNQLSSLIIKKATGPRRINM